MIPWTAACPSPLSMEFSRQEYWSGLPFPSPRDHPDLEMKPRSPTLQADFYQLNHCSVQFSLSVKSDSLQPHELPHARPPLSITNCRSLPRPMATELMMPSNHLILCHPLLLLPSIFPSIRVFSTELALSNRWPKYWSFGISPSNEYSGWISFRMD